jgi:hypothetical protein
MLFFDGKPKSIFYFIPAIENDNFFLQILPKTNGTFLKFLLFCASYAVRVCVSIRHAAR